MLNLNSTVKKNIFLFLLFLLSFTLSPAQSKGGKVDWKKIHALVYTKNGKGYVHENIPSAIASLQQLAKEKGFTVEASEDPVIFTTENLKKFNLLIFASTNNDVFDSDDQRLAFRQFIEGGGGFVGIHSVVGTERNWRWFKNLLGGTFEWHPTFQKYQIQVIDAQHPTVTGFPKTWEKEDECYFMKEIYPGIKTIMAHNLTTLVAKENENERINASAKPFFELYPAVWTQQYDGGTVWITALGHDKKDYSDPTYMQHIFQGIAFVAQQSTKPDFKKSYAKTKDDPIRY